MTDNSLANTEVTDTAEQTNNQAEETTKTYTQREVDDLLARTKGSITKKISSKYEDLGDADELRAIVEQHRKQQQDTQLKKGEFEKVLQELASKKDAEISKRDRVIEEFKINSPILDSASRHRAVAPEQVQALLRSNVRLNEFGEPEVTDKEGKVRYADNGKPLSVDSYVSEFLTKNPHFISASPSTTATKSSLTNRTQTVDISTLDMNNAEHRAIYKEYRRTQGIK
jgi:hypothetical protein